MAKIKDVLVSGTQNTQQQQQQQKPNAFKTVNTKVTLGNVRTEIDVRFIAGVPSADGTKTSEYVVDGKVYGMNIFAFGPDKKLFRNDFVMNKALWNYILDNYGTTTIDGQEVFDFEAGDLIIAVFREDEPNWVSAGPTETGLELKAGAEALRKASSLNLLANATKS